MSLLETCESWNPRGNYQEWHNTTSKDKGERIELYFGMQDEEYLSSSEKNIDEHFEKELNPWWAIMQSLYEELR